MAEDGVFQRYQILELCKAIALFQEIDLQLQWNWDSVA